MANMAGDEVPKCIYGVKLWEVVTGKNGKRMYGVVVVSMIDAGGRTRRKTTLHQLKSAGSLCRGQGWVHWGLEGGVHHEVHDACD
jgi:hypothetical protein